MCIIAHSSNVFEEHFISKHLIEWISNWEPKPKFKFSAGALIFQLPDACHVDSLDTSIFSPRVLTQLPLQGLHSSHCD